MTYFRGKIDTKGSGNNIVKEVEVKLALSTYFYNNWLHTSLKHPKHRNPHATNMTAE
jgi:hypothetical protein